MSKWRAATGELHPPEVEKTKPAASPNSDRFSGLLPLLLLLGASLWFWEQMPDPLSDPPRQPPSQGPSEAEGTVEGEAADLADPKAPAGGSIEPKVTKEARPEPEIPAGGESPLDWRPIVPPSQRPAELSDWYHDHDGYIRALRRRTHVDRPLILYFRTDWCPWSRRFEREFLEQPKVSTWTSNQIRVVLNADNGPDEAALVQRLGITGFPAFFVIPRQGGQPKALRPYPEGVAIPIDAFVVQGKRAGGR